MGSRDLRTRCARAPARGRRGERLSANLQRPLAATSFDRSAGNLRDNAEIEREEVQREADFATLAIGAGRPTSSSSGRSTSDSEVRRFRGSMPLRQSCRCGAEVSHRIAWITPNANRLPTALQSLAPREIVPDQMFPPLSADLHNARIGLTGTRVMNRMHVEAGDVRAGGATVASLGDEPPSPGLGGGWPRECGGD